MQEMYVRLAEKEKRLYAGVEALKLPYGGVSYIAELFGCCRNTVMRGIAELRGQEIIPRKRNRSAGGGRKQLVEIKGNNDIDEVFLLILKEHTAGNPVDEKVKWTNLTKANIAELLAEEGLKVSRNIIVKLLKKHGYVKRKPLKKKAGGGHVNRNTQKCGYKCPQERIAELRKLFESEGNPVISVDTKKKGNYSPKSQAINKYGSKMASAILFNG